MTTRRRFIGDIGSLFCCVPFLSAAGSERAGSSRISDLEAYFSKLCAVSQNAALIGRAYMTLSSCERDLTVLTSRLAEKLPATISPDRVSAKVASTIRLDFDRGDVVTVEGWVLSRTEAQICALSYLRNKSLA